MIEVIIVMTGIGVLVPICLAANALFSKMSEMQRELRSRDAAIMQYLEEKGHEPLLLKEGKQGYSLTVLGREVVKEERFDR